ncbi:hypothetical protein CPC08DRAFT_780314 [Agrocybe pediades]|nr:hypothetical protein CPC08DRAFT_780314 [Agrocybe pediades]
MSANVSEQAVFVDDSDPNIIYHGWWAASRQLPTDFKSLLFPTQSRTPWYGTSHTLISNSGGFSYKFHVIALTQSVTGTEIAAIVSLAMPDATLKISSCTIDNVAEKWMLGAGGLAICTNNKTLSDGEHTLSLEFTPGAADRIMFDGLYYRPTQMPSKDSDISYSTGFSTQPGYIPSGAQQLAMSSPGDALDFQFHGTSISVYCQLLLDPGATSALEYVLDGQAPINFTITSPDSDTVFSSTLQLLVQTPSISPGMHSMRINLLDSQPDPHAAKITLVQYIIQNSTRSLNLLEAVPPVTTTLSSTEALLSATAISPSFTRGPSGTSSLTRHAKVVVAVACATTLAAVVTIGICIWWVWKRKKKKCSEDNATARALSLPDPSELGRFRVYQHTTTEKTGKYRAMFGGASARDSVSRTEGSSQRTRSPGRARYRVHEDGGSIVSETGTEGVVDLPPCCGTRQIKPSSWCRLEGTWSQKHYSCPPLHINILASNDNDVDICGSIKSAGRSQDTLTVAQKELQMRLDLNSVMMSCVLSVPPCTLLTGFNWYGVDWAFIANGDTRDSVFLATSGHPPALTHLLQNIAFFGSFILADWLMIWRCYHVWSSSRRIIIIPLILLAAEIVVYLVMIATISANLRNITDSKARLFDSLQIALYIIPAANSVLVTYLISYRVYVGTFPLPEGRAMQEPRRRRKVRRVIDIVVQSSAIYTVLLLARAALSSPEPLSERAGSRSSLALEAATDYLDITLTLFAGLIPTIMVARVLLLSLDADSTDNFSQAVSRIDFSDSSVERASSKSHAE